MRRLPILALICSVSAIWATASHAADDISEEFMTRFNEVAVAADETLAGGDVDGAIQMFEDLMLEHGEYGRIHLRLAQLHQVRGRWAQAAHHFWACQQDDRMDQVDRDLICRAGFEENTAPLVLETEQSPEGVEVVVIAPEIQPFMGDVTSGERVPVGSIQVVVRAPGREEAVHDLAITTPETRWVPLVGPTPEEAAAAAAQPQPASTSDLTAASPLYPEPEPMGRWPAYVAAGVGLALVGTGVWLGLDSDATVDDIRDRQSAGRCGADDCVGELDDAATQAGLADGLWISGAAITAGAGVLFFALGGDE